MDIEPQPFEPKLLLGWKPALAGLVLALFGIGLPLIGITINLVLGSIILILAFALIVWGIWIWDGKSSHRKVLRIILISILSIFYFSFVGCQIHTQYQKDHPAMPTIIPNSPPPTVPTGVINQQATGSDCSNNVAGGNVNVDCKPKEKQNAKLPPTKKP